MMLRMFLLAIVAGVTECTVHEATLQALNGFLPTFREAAQVTMRQARRLSAQNYCKWNGNGRCGVNVEWAHAAATKINSPIVLALATKQLECEAFTSESTCPSTTHQCKWDQGTCNADMDDKKVMVELFGSKCGILGKMLAASESDECAEMTCVANPSTTDKCRQSSETQITANGLECVEKQTCVSNVQGGMGKQLFAMMCPDLDMQSQAETCQKKVMGKLPCATVCEVCKGQGPEDATKPECSECVKCMTAVTGGNALTSAESQQQIMESVAECITTAVASSCPDLAAVMKAATEGAAVCGAQKTEGSCSGEHGPQEQQQQPCASVCNPEVCKGPEDKDKPECLECEKCHRAQHPCAAVCPSEVCKGPEDAAKAECLECATCHDQQQQQHGQRRLSPAGPAGTCEWGNGRCHPGQMAFMMSLLPAECPLAPAMELGMTLDAACSPSDQSKCQANPKCAWRVEAECGLAGLPPHDNAHCTVHEGAMFELLMAVGNDADTKMFAQLMQEGPVCDAADTEAKCVAHTVPTLAPLPATQPTAQPTALPAAVLPVQTTLKQPIAAGANQLEAVDDAVLLVGRQITIDANTDKEETTNVVGVVADTATQRRLAGGITVNPPFKFEHAAGATIDEVPVSTTSTVTPWDSSASSSDTDLLASLDSGSLHRDSSGSDSSGSGGSSGSKASGSSGSNLELWQWLLVLGLCCLCCAGAGGAAMTGKPKPKKKKKSAAPASPPASPPAPEPVAEVMPLLMPAQMPVTTAYAAPMTTSYAAPMTTSYAAPMTTAYAAPTANYAAPMANYAAAPMMGTTSYAMAPGMQV